ncbi:MAG: tetratricopeptide repeat protein [Calditrichaeota bacterium]|nr:tetratricopeptide repeat protein [Calditrichota bacterium]
MFAKKNLHKTLTVALVLGFAIMLAVTLMTGCATTGGGQKQTLSPERQKAIKDSLRKIWDRKLNIAWSTGYEHTKNKLYREAIPYFWKVVKLDTIKRFPDLYTFLGDCYIKLNKPDSAMIVYRMGTEKYPQKSHYHRSLAWLLAGKQQASEAIEEYKKAIAIDSTNVSDYKALGNLLVSENRNDEAIEVYQKILKMEPKNAEAQKVYAQLLGTTGDQDAVIEAQEKALKMDPENTDLMYTLGETYFKLSEFQKTIEKFNLYLKLKPNDTFALEYLGKAQQNLEQYHEAIATYEKIIAIKPDSKKILCDMATSYKELNQLRKARSIANKALNIDPNYGLAYIVRGEIYEVAVDNCMNKRGAKSTSFDDKLIYKLAYDQYAKATKDIQFADLARRKMNYLQPDIPTKEDYFMHQSQKKAKTACYQWIY